MNFRLHEGLTFCEAGRTHVFLDVRNNRYFCLSDELEESFRLAISEGVDAALSHPARDALCRAGIFIVEASGGLPQPCRHPVPALSSALDEITPDLPWSHLLGMGARLFTVSRRLKNGRLLRSLEVISLAKRRGTVRAPKNHLEILRAVKALELMRFGASAEDQCLRRSMALAHHLAARGITSDLIIGVKLGPFAAHCWVQRDSKVLNDRPENIRDFTPILVL